MAEHFDGWRAPAIDFSNFETRRDEIAQNLWDVTTNVGFFYVVNHGIPQHEIDKMFEASARFFSLPTQVKKQVAWDRVTNNGWETGTEILDEKIADMKETYNLGFVKMDGKWLDEDALPEFRAQSEHFQKICEEFSYKIMSCFALKLGFPEDFFKQHHDPTKDDCTKILRLLHYPELTEEQVKQAPPGQLRAGEHTDYGCVTLLFQKMGEAGLEVCPGFDKERTTWTPVDPQEGSIVINIGDSLMRWSDDKIKSNWHRVRVPRLGESLKARYSLAFFNQPNGSAVIEGPLRKYPTISARDYLNQRFTATYK